VNVLAGKNNLRASIWNERDPHHFFRCSQSVKRHVLGDQHQLHPASCINNNNNNDNDNNYFIGKKNFEAIAANLSRGIVAFQKV
jgi:hypothetical protein